MPAVADPAAGKRRRGLDALGELEKLRRQVRTPRPTGRANGHGELEREIQLTIQRADFHRLRHVRLSLQVEDEQRQVVEAVRDVQVEIDGGESLDRLLLRLNVALSARD